MSQDWESVEVKKLAGSEREDGMESLVHRLTIIMTQSNRSDPILR